MKAFEPEDFLILAVDDVRLNLQVVGLILDRAGYETSFATSGNQALDRVADDRPDLILLDLMMPEMDGIEVCQRLQADPATQEIPIIFLTASTEQKDAIKAFEAGAVDYITKPLNAAELLKRVQTHLDLQRTRRELDRLAQLDPLTQLLHRQSWLAAVAAQLEQAQPSGGSFGIILLDLDDFQAVNDRHGLAVGDAALRAVADLLHPLVPPGGAVGRWGGDAFALLLPGSDEPATAELAAQVQAAIGQLSPAPAPLQSSLALTCWQAGDRAIEDLLGRAEQALRAARGTGRRAIARAGTVEML